MRAVRFPQPIHPLTRTHTRTYAGAKTPKDKNADLKIHAKCDEVMKRVMVSLNLPVGPYVRFDAFRIGARNAPLDYQTKKRRRLELKRLRPGDERPSADVRVYLASVHGDACPIACAAGAAVAIFRVEGNGGEEGALGDRGNEQAGKEREVVAEAAMDGPAPFHFDVSLPEGQYVSCWQVSLKAALKNPAEGPIALDEHGWTVDWDKNGVVEASIDVQAITQRVEY